MWSTALTFGIAALVIALLNIGWKFFKVETDPVRLWVSPTSESALQKTYFDENFGPFYRAQQVFVMALPPSLGQFADGQVTSDNLTSSSANNHDLPANDVLTYDNLDWWLQHEKAISQLKSEPNGYSLQDVCFAPAGPGTPCVVQSVSAWLGTDMEQWGDDWVSQLEDCATTPSNCLPDFGQPIDPKLVLGGAKGDWLKAKSLVITWVVGNSLDKEQVAKAEEWETALEKYLRNVEQNSARDANIKIAYSTGISLEQELNKVS